ncbi:flavodoxin domain-containing protein, partial [Butyrivibrio sp. FCS006]|uniref:flavodoxin domain-containing protein n=1 Tax=Butyrivibrio sp. FCS006 TaxID=1280684 RepID=UPI00040FD4D3
MSKVAIVYWSGTGNTQSMAEAVKAGAVNSGASVDMFTPSEFSSSMVSGYDAIA